MTDFIQSARIAQSTHCPRRLRAAGQRRGTAREGDCLGKELKPRAPVSDLSGCLAAPPDSTAAVKCLHSQRSSYKVIFFKSGLDWHFHNKKSSFLILLYVASKILSQPRSLSRWFHWYSVRRISLNSSNRLLEDSLLFTYLAHTYSQLGALITTKYQHQIPCRDYL